MNRYSIALGKEKSILKKPEKSIIFNNGTRWNYDKAKLFKLYSGSIHRVGIVYSNPEKLFVKAHVHFHNGHFLCKSIYSGKKEICCKCFGRAFLRVIYIVIDYGSTNIYRYSLPTENFQVLPWALSRGTHEKLNELHKTSFLNCNDFIVSVPFWAKYKFYQFAPGEKSLWQKSAIISEIRDRARPMLSNIEKYLGKDLTHFEIEQLFDRSKRFSNRNLKKGGKNALVR